MSNNTLTQKSTHRQYKTATQTVHKGGKKTIHIANTCALRVRWNNGATTIAHTIQYMTPTTMEYYGATTIAHTLKYMTPTTMDYYGATSIAHTVQYMALTKSMCSENSAVFSRFCGARCIISRNADVSVLAPRSAAALSA